MNRLAKLRLSAAAALTLLAVMPAQAASPCPPKPSVLVEPIPPEVCRRDWEAFAHMAWQTFKMLVWPASSRGQADEARKITDMDGPRVFETYKSDWETFLADAARPLDWDFYPARAPVCKNSATMPPLPEGSLVLASLSKFGNITQTDVAIDSSHANITHALVAQNGSLVRYLTAFDKKSFNLIQKNELYGPLTVPPSDDAPIPGKTKADVDTITIKSAWIEIRNSSPDASKFFTRWAWVQEPDSQMCREVLVALVALHFVHKTPSSPQWIWASFEHVRNAPPRDNPPGMGYTFNDGSGAPMDPEPPQAARMPINPWVVPPAYNIERWWPVADTNQTVNGLWRDLLQVAGSVWSNYELVVVEWPFFDGVEEMTGLGIDVGEKSGARPTPPCMFGDQTNLANTVIETFVQRKVDCSERTTCMSCHNSARNYDFIWSIPLKDNSSSAASVASGVRRSALSILREITGFSSRK